MPPDGSLTNQALEWAFSIAKSVAMGVAFWVLWSIRGAFLAGWNVQRFISDEKAARAVQDKRIDEIEKRLDRGGKLTSDLASDVQGLPEAMRAEFLTRRESDLIIVESRADRARLSNEIDNLWKVVNRRGWARSEE